MTATSAASGVDAISGIDAASLRAGRRSPAGTRLAPAARRR
ncbi:hypothetical protein ACFYUL_12325 [Streptomyces sp. NPDC004311]